MRRRLTQCRECGRKTSHTILSSTRTTTRYDEGEHIFTVNYEICRCNGCRTVTLRRRVRDSASPHDPPDEEVYPPRFAFTDYAWLPYKVRSVYRETVVALASQQPILGAVGIRAILEAVCKHRTPTERRTLEASIDELVATGLITKSNAGVLHTIRRLTNETIHEAKTPSWESLALAMRIVEHLLNSVYRLPFEAGALERHATGGKRQAGGAQR